MADTAVRFIHVADIHFGVENYGKLDPQTGVHSRLHDFQRALTACIDTALAERVDFFLFAGDAYKTAHPSPTQQRMLLSCFFRLFAAGIPVVIVVGNHDTPLSFGKTHALDIFHQLPMHGFHVISRPTTLTLETRSGPVSIVGIPWPTRGTLALNTSRHATTQELNEQITSCVRHYITQTAEKLDPQIPAILTGHLTVSNARFSGSEHSALHGSDPIFMPSDLAIAPFDYIALGHIHRHQDLNPAGKTPIVYAGSIERIDFGERKEEKGYCCVTIDSRKNTSYEFRTTPTRPFIQVETTVPAEGDQTEHICQEIKRHTVEGAIVKVVYHVPPQAHDTVDHAKIHTACRQAHDVAGILPIHPPRTKTQRLPVSVDMDSQRLLSLYFHHEGFSKKLTNRLLEKARTLDPNDTHTTSSSV